MPLETYEKITPAERDTTLRVPRPAPEERTGIGQEIFFDTPIKEDRIQRSFGTRSDLMPLVRHRRGVNCNLFRFCLLPAAFSVREEVINNPLVVTIDPATTSIILFGPCSTLDTYRIVSAWSPMWPLPCVLVLVTRR